MKTASRWAIILLVVWVGLAIVLAFSDLDISQSIYNPAARWAQTLEIYGEIPGLLVAFTCGNILLRLNKLEKNTRGIAGLAALGLAIFFIGFFMLANAFGFQNSKPLNIPTIIGVDLALILISQVILHRLPAERLASHAPSARVGLALVITAGLTVWAFKIPWGRWNYREILAVGDLSLFSPWYLPQGYNGHFSFISGHAAMFMCVLPATLFIRDRSTLFNLSIILCLVWGVIGSVSRVVIGAHFASDVLFGACETILWFILLTRWLPVGPSTSK